MLFVKSSRRLTSDSCTSARRARRPTLSFPIRFFSSSREEEKNRIGKDSVGRLALRALVQESDVSRLELFTKSMSRLGPNRSLRSQERLLEVRCLLKHHLDFACVDP